MGVYPKNLFHLVKFLLEQTGAEGQHDIKHVIDEPKRKKIPYETLGMVKDEGYENIMRVFRQATREEIDYWGNWYRHAHQHVRNLAEEYILPIEIIAGVCAVLSPNLKWRENVMSARRVLDNWHHEQLSYEDITKGEVAPYKFWDKIPSYSANVRKAMDILDEGDTGYVRGPKVTVFFYSLLSPEKTTRDVVLDGHAINIWRGKKAPLSNMRQPTKAERMQIENDYKAVAEEVGMTPQQVQAIAWFIWKSVHDIPPSPQLEFDLTPPELKEAMRDTPGFEKIILEQSIPRSRKQHGC